MASSLGLDDSVPQWKKDLILRKRLAGSGGTKQGTDRSAASCSPAARQERCDGAVSVNVVNMVQDSVLVMRPVQVATATNGDCCRGSDSDSSEELQYGPGIVSKLKSKYLSLTLRETHATAPRPSILPLRRAASLEQLLDADEPPVKTAPAPPRRFTPRVPAAGATTAPSPRYRAQTRRNGTEAVKRARSVETISRTQHHQEEIVPVKPVPGARKPCRPLRITPVLDQAERPPADHVKQTLRLFEGPALKRTKAPAPTGDVAAKVASFKQIIQQNKPGTPPPPPPPPLSPKPTILPPKPINIPPPPGSPVKTAPSSPIKTTTPSSPVKTSAKPVVQEPSPIPDVLDAAAGLCPTPDLIVHSSPQSRPFSPRTLQDVTQNFLKSEISHSQETHPKPPPVTSPPPIVRPKSPSPITPHQNVPEPIKTSRSPSPRMPPPDPPTSKEITQQAVDNIAKAGHTITYRFADALSSPKSQSHLPRLNTIPVRIKLVPDTTMSSPPLKPVAVASPTTKKVVNGASRPTAPAPKAPLTSREIEKNTINKQKTLEQPVSRVVVAMRSVDEVVAKKAKPRGVPPPQETTILFDFSDRKSIPDYIATDGSQSTRRGKREKPKPGESGIILLPGAPSEEFADDDEDWLLSLNGPPSPCDVHFVNDNVLIDGRSSISKQPKRQKMRIQFDDDATQVFEYLSEASALEDAPPPTPPVTSPPPVAGHTVPSLTGSSLASYTPSKMSVSADFQLGVTRQAPAVVTAAPQAAAPDSLDLLPVQAEHPVTYSAETTADILF